MSRLGVFQPTPDSHKNGLICTQAFALGLRRQNLNNIASRQSKDSTGIEVSKPFWTKAAEAKSHDWGHGRAGRRFTESTFVKAAYHQLKSVDPQVEIPHGTFSWPNRPNFSHTPVDGLPECCLPTWQRFLSIEIQPMDGWPSKSSTFISVSFV